MAENSIWAKRNPENPLIPQILILTNGMPQRGGLRANLIPHYSLFPPKKLSINRLRVYNSARVWWTVKVFSGGASAWLNDGT